MEVETKLAPFGVCRDCVCGFWCVFLVNLIKLDQRGLFCAILDDKCWILNYLAKILAKKNKPKQSTIFFPLKIKSTNQQHCLIWFIPLKIKSTNQQQINNTNQQINKSTTQHFQKMWIKITQISLNIHKNLNPDNSL